MRIALLPAVLLLGTPFPAQTPASPPVKAGLWEVKVTKKQTDEQPTTGYSRQCLTREAWAHMLDGSQLGAICKMQTAQTGNLTTVHGDCKLGDVPVSMQLSRVVLDAEHFTNSATVEMNFNGRPLTIVVQTAAHFVSESCGDLKPGESRPKPDGQQQPW